MVRRMTAAVVVAVMLAAPAMALAQGPKDQERAQTIVNQIAQHACEAATLVASMFGGWAVICPK